MKPALQAKLLHVLQDAEFTKLGSNKRVEVDVRVVAATNRDLEKMMVSGDFREDLYYRLQGHRADRAGAARAPRRDPDADRLLPRALLAQVQPPAPPIVRRAAAAVPEYDWPGNIRELENMIKRIVVLQDEQLVVRGDRAQHAARRRGRRRRGGDGGAVRRRRRRRRLPRCRRRRRRSARSRRRRRPRRVAERTSAADDGRAAPTEGGGSLAAVAKAAR